VQVARVERQTKEQVVAQLEAEYEKRVKELGDKPTGLDYYELAVFCIKNQMDDRLTALLEKAVTLDRNVMVAATEGKARNLYNLYVYLQKKGNSEGAESKRRELISKYPNSKYAKMVGAGQVAVKDPPVKPPDKPKDPPVKPPVDPPPDNPPPDDPPVDPPPVDPPPAGEPPKFANARVASLVEKGNKAYEQGMIHLEKSYDDKTSDRDGENMKALAAFKEACSAYEAAVEIEPANAWLNDRLRQAGENRVQCFLAAKARR